MYRFPCKKSKICLRGSCTQFKYDTSHVESIKKIQHTSCHIAMVVQNHVTGTKSPVPRFSSGRERGAQCIQNPSFPGAIHKIDFCIACVRKLKGHGIRQTLATWGKGEETEQFGLEFITMNPPPDLTQPAVGNAFLTASPWWRKRRTVLTWTLPEELILVSF